MVYHHKNRQKELRVPMSELPEKQVKRLHALIQEAETNLAAAKELLIKYGSVKKAVEMAE